MRSFGCLCYPTIPKCQRDKFQANITPNIFIGYPFGSKGYKVLRLTARKIHISRDVVVKENIFLFVVVSDISYVPFVLNSVPCIDSVNTEIGSHNVPHVDNNVLDARNIPQSVDLPSAPVDFSSAPL